MILRLPKVGDKYLNAWGKVRTILDIDYSLKRTVDLKVLYEDIKVNHIHDNFYDLVVGGCGWKLL